ncbi:hypothetical protein DNHGIG_26060 [Collibacillus ludicampi]|uniref:Uncharacterized protein n=1 Tax=Collibacillus ludicampi TaxID=2771369 RepID=A0AAV4LGW8_9BACL|nr:hypothetical protein [Collibacillus ludicampi]GIM47057.1 hypothetical protein DNHGIG_26060 [Collibacillus ludicampi]
MTIIKIFSQPIILTIVWLVGFRPASAIISKFPTLSKNIPDATKGTIDVAVVSSLIALLAFLWKRPIEISTKLVNVQNRRNHSTFRSNNHEITHKVRLDINMKIKNLMWIKLLRWVGGFFLSPIGNKRMIGHQFDGTSHDETSSMVVIDDGQSKIHFFQPQFDPLDHVDLEFTLHLFPNMRNVRTVNLVLGTEPAAKFWLKKLLAKIAIALFVDIKLDTHTVFIDCD